MKSLKKMMVLLPLAAMAASCSGGGAGKNSALPAGGKAADIVFGSEEVRNTFADSVEQFVKNVLSSKTLELGSKLDYTFKVDLKELTTPYGQDSTATFKAGVGIEDVKSEVNAGVSFLNDKVVAYADAKGSGKASVSYSIPDNVWADAKAGSAQSGVSLDDFGIKQSNSDSFEAKELEVKAYLKDGVAYVDGSKDANRSFVKSVLNTKLANMSKVKEFAKQYGVDIDKIVDEASLKYKFPVGDIPVPQLPAAPADGVISGYVKQALAMLNSPDEQAKQYIDLAKEIISLLNFQTYVYSADSDYSYGVEMKIDGMAQVQKIYEKVMSVVDPTYASGAPKDLVAFLKGYGFDIKTFKLGLAFAFGVKGNLFVGFEEEIDVDADVNIDPVVVKGNYLLKTDAGVELKASNNDISGKLPSADELAKFEEFDPSKFVNKTAQLA